MTFSVQQTPQSAEQWTGHLESSDFKDRRTRRVLWCATEENDSSENALSPVCTKHANTRSQKQRVYRKGTKWTTAISPETPIYPLPLHPQWLLLGGPSQVADSLRAKVSQTSCRSELHLCSTSHRAQWTLCSWEQMPSCAHELLQLHSIVAWLWECTHQKCSWGLFGSLHKTQGPARIQKQKCF